MAKAKIYIYYLQETIDNLRLNRKKKTAILSHELTLAFF